jgi:hypothetical protein
MARRGILRHARILKRGWRAYRQKPRLVKILIGGTVILILWLAVNWIYQVIRKPSELFFPVSGTLYKTPGETWQQYASIFQKYATNVMTADLLAAIAQVEGSGNPVARTYWRWAWTSQPFEMYRPASSAVGMYQITDGTFADARRFCIHDHAVVEDGPWNDWKSCWFTSLYARVVPADAVELASAYLDHAVAGILGRRRISGASLQHKQTLAAIIHLCGAGAGEDYARRGFRLIEGQRCGDHEARVYLDRVFGMKAVFEQLQAMSKQ